MSDVPEVIQRAARVFPGGVLGSHRSGPGLEFVVREGRGPYLWDTTGRRYIDYLLGSGPMLLGHAHPAVVGAVQRQLSRGTTYMLLNEPVTELAEELVPAVKGCERVVVPAPGFLQGVRAVTRRYGVPLIFDEIVTGFRLAYGGAQEYYGVVPDLVTLGKVIAGGFPLGAVGGPAEIMRHFDPALEGTTDYVWQSGTLNGNPIAAAAGVATLGELRTPGTYDRLHTMGTRLRQGLADAARRHGLTAQVTGEPPVFDILFTDRPIVDHRAVITADPRKIRRFNEECLRRGVVKASNKIYVSVTHTDADIDETLRVFDEALGVVAASSDLRS